MTCIAYVDIDVVVVAQRAASETLMQVKHHVAINVNHVVALALLDVHKSLRLNNHQSSAITYSVLLVLSVDLHILQSLLVLGTRELSSDLGLVVLKGVLESEVA